MAPLVLILKDTILVCGRVSSSCPTSGTVSVNIKGHDTRMLLVVPVPLVAPLVLILKDTILVCSGKVSSSCPTSGTVSVNIKGHDTRKGY